MLTPLARVGAVARRRLLPVCRWKCAVGFVLWTKVCAQGNTKPVTTVPQHSSSRTNGSVKARSEEGSMWLKDLVQRGVLRVGQVLRSHVSHRAATVPPLFCLRHPTQHTPVLNRREKRAPLGQARTRTARNSWSNKMLDSSACSRVSLLVVALGLVCTCCNSFLVPAGPHSSGVGQRSVRGVSRLITGRAGRAARMMAGDLDVSLVWLFR